MKYIVICMLLGALCMPAIGQKHAIDSLQAAYDKAKQDTERVLILYHIGNLYAQNQPDSELFKAQQALFISKQRKYIKGEAISLKQMADAYQFMGNYPLALQYYLQRLKLDEENPDPVREVVTLISIANLYETEGDYALALVYAKKANVLIEKNKLEDFRWYSYMSFGNLYEKTNNIVQAKYYNQQAYNIAVSKNEGGWIGMCLNNMGNTYLKDIAYTQAEGYYRSAIPYLKQDHNDNFLCESYQGLATILSHFNKRDSAIYYAKNSLQLALNSHLSNYYLQSCQLLTSFYKTNKQADSALAYQGKLLEMKDSIYSQEKVKHMENLTLSEKLRQKERQQELLQDEQDRSYKMKMLLIGLSIPFCFLISVLLSKRKIKSRVVEFSGILSLLLLFEYLTLLLHPIIGNLTDHSPFLEIIILVVIAAILTPTHHRLEHWMLHQLTHKPHHGAAVAEEPAVALVNEETTETGSADTKP